MSKVKIFITQNEHKTQKNKSRSAYVICFFRGDYMSFALKLKELREKNNLTQRELAHILNVGTGTVGMWESTTRIPPTKRMKEISNFFNISIEELLEDELTPAERAAGLSETRKMNVTPIEDDLLYVFRQIGKRFGEQAQRDYITVGENMLKLK